MNLVHRSYPIPSGKIQESIQALFVQHNWSLSIAESCTGGGIASRLIQIAGASQYFEGGIVCYSNRSKHSLLGVSEMTLKDYGAVSQQTVKEMALGLMDILPSDFCLAVTGIAGPSGGNAQKPVGTVWAAVMHKGEEPLTWKFQAFGHRKAIIENSIQTCLSELFQYCKRYA